jgi:di/tripeptidase
MSLWQRALEIFTNDICSIPRHSDNEEHIKSYLLRFSEEKNGECLYDSTSWNICIKIAWKWGGINGKPVILQSHLDMVAVKKTW